MASIDGKLLLFSILFALILAHVGADDSVVVDAEPREDQVFGSDVSDPSSLQTDLHQFKSRIQALESQIDEKTRELKEKDAIIADREYAILGKTDTIVSLESEIASLQKRGRVDAQELVGRVHARAAEFEKEVEQLKKEMEARNKEREILEARMKDAEQKASALNSKINELQQIVVEQKSKIHKTERALQVAEEEMMKAKFEATSRTKELMEVHGAWFPPWLVTHLIHCQAFLEEHWKLHGKPIMDLAVQKAIEKKAQAQKWAEPHIETMKAKWIPAAKDQWFMITTYVEPHVQSLIEKTAELYKTSKSTITQHVIRVQEHVDPYFQKVKKFSRPYIDQIAVAAKPHVDKVRGALKPYSKKVVHVYGRFLESASTQHNQVQDLVHETLKKYELTRPLATKELVWFAASAFLALPIIIIVRVCSAAFCSKKVSRPVKNGNPSQSRRKAKRGRPDK